MNNKLTFSQILEEEKQKDKAICSKISNELEKEGINVSTRQIQNYKSSKAVPSYEIAVEIMKVIHSKHSNKDLQKILMNSRGARKRRIDSKITNPNELVFEKNKNKHYRVTLRNADFTFLEGTGVNNNKSLEFIENNIAEKYGEDKYAFSRYIADLINQCMKN